MDRRALSGLGNVVVDPVFPFRYIACVEGLGEVIQFGTGRDLCAFHRYGITPNDTPLVLATTATRRPIGPGSSGASNGHWSIMWLP